MQILKDQDVSINIIHKDKHMPKDSTHWSPRAEPEVALPCVAGTVAEPGAVQ